MGDFIWDVVGLLFALGVAFFVMITVDRVDIGD